MQVMCSTYIKLLIPALHLNQYFNAKTTHAISLICLHIHLLSAGINYYYSCSKPSGVTFEKYVLIFFRGAASCAEQKETFVMDFLKLMNKKKLSFYRLSLKKTEEEVGKFFQELLGTIDVLTLPLKKVLVCLIHHSQHHCVQDTKRALILN